MIRCLSSFCYKINYIIFRAQSVENLGLAVVALLTGIIVDADGYYMVELFFCILLSGKNYIIKGLL